MRKRFPLIILAVLLVSCAQVQETGEWKVANEYVVTLANQDEFQVRVVFHPSPYAGVSWITVDVPMKSRVGDRLSSALFYMKDRRGMIMNNYLRLDGDSDTTRCITLEVRSSYLDKAHIHLFYRNEDQKINSRYDIDMASYKPYKIAAEFRVP
jgi:hypothetical protein